ncbi:MAG: 5'/3'-nucleotidase SurE [Chromatiales bacterium]|nr:5'/3'-nucleotidase SurE [Chromatiales bacterium]
MHILLSNDDGYLSRGTKLLFEALSEFVQVTAVTPTRNRSAASNSLTLDRPLRTYTIDKNFYAVDGTPTDCVHLALTGLLKDTTLDMVVSGINHGPNLGDDVLYSGTVAAAMEGRFLGFPAIAVSLTNRQPTQINGAVRIACNLIKRLLSSPISADILNINIPDLPYEQIVGTEITRLGARHKSDPVIETTDPQGNPIYWVGASGSEQDAGPGTDFYAINHNRVSITPLDIDLTNHKLLAELREIWNTV